MGINEKIDEIIQQAKQEKIYDSWNLYSLVLKE